MGPALAVVSNDRIRDNGHKQKGRKFYLNTRKNCFEGHRQPRKDGESPSRDIPNPPGHKPGQHALNEPALAEGFDMMISKGSF